MHNGFKLLKTDYNVFKAFAVGRIKKNVSLALFF